MSTSVFLRVFVLLGIVVTTTARAQDAASPTPIRVGIIGLDAHAVPWTQIITDPKSPAPIHEMQVVAAVPAFSPDGDQGYPGNLDVSVLFTLTAACELRIDYAATTDQPTPVNLTHHGYFNLAGAATGNVLGHWLQLAADRYTPTDAAIASTNSSFAVQDTRRGGCGRG